MTLFCECVKIIYTAHGFHFYVLKKCGSLSSAVVWLLIMWMKIKAGNFMGKLENREVRFERVIQIVNERKKITTK